MSIQTRAKEWLKFRKYLASNANYQFATNLSKNNNATGKLCFDHERKHLSLEVNVDPSGEANKATHDAKALSGGERSQATIAFITALGEAADAPFRAIDEFDIFMDAVNRKKSLNHLIDTANFYPDRQFIFITPHDISMLTGSNVRIFKLHPPREDQGVIA